MKTYKNINGQPILRSCFNCKHFKPLPDNPQQGYCKARALMFAYTLQETVYAMVKSFYLCGSHTLPNEDYLKGIGAEEVDLAEVVKNKNQ